MTRSRILKAASRFITASGPQVLWTPSILNPTASYEESASSAGAVATLTDKTGNGWNLTQASSTLRPTIQTNILNGKSVITFDGGDFISSASNFTITGDLAVTILIVYRKTVANAGTAFGWGNTTALNAFGIYDDNSAISGVNYGGGNNYRFANKPVNTWMIMTLAKSPGPINTTSVARLNGSDNAGTGHSTTTPNVVAGPLVLGQWANLATPKLAGSIAEFHVIPGTASLADLQRLEGYAASTARWGLQASLPADHPYKSSPPYI